MSAFPNDFARLVDAFLDTTVGEIVRARAVPRLAEPMLYSLAAGGKRLRPVLCLLAAGADGGDGAQNDLALLTDYERSALYLGSALECIHTYSLIHDDLPAMDDDDLRRGQPSCHVKFGDWAAILAGDALNTLAFELVAIAFAQGEPEAGVAATAVAVLGEAAGMSGMVSGQALDLAFEKDPAPNDGASFSENQRRELLREIHLKKTTAMIRASLELGAVLSGADRAAYREYGESIGLLFQISDDLLDRTGTSESLGKTPGKDEAAGKLTYPALYGMDESRRIASELAERARAVAGDLAPGPRGQRDHRAVFSALPDQILHRTR